MYVEERRYGGDIGRNNHRESSFGKCGHREEVEWMMYGETESEVCGVCKGKKDRKGVKVAHNCATIFFKTSINDIFSLQEDSSSIISLNPTVLFPRMVRRDPLEAIILPSFLPRVTVLIPTMNQPKSIQQPYTLSLRY